MVWRCFQHDSICLHLTLAKCWLKIVLWNLSIVQRRRNGAVIKKKLSQKLVEAQAMLSACTVFMRDI